MRSKTLRRQKTPQPRRSHTNRQVLIGIVLLVVGAVAALTIERMPSGPVAVSSSASPSRAPSESVEPSLEPSASTSEEPSGSPSPTPSPTSAILENELPKAINGTQLTVTSTTGVSALGTSPSARALGAAIVSLGKSVDGLELAYAYDPAGTLEVSVLGFRIPGVDVAKLRQVVLTGWLSADATGVKTSTVTLSGEPVDKVVYDASGPNDYVLTRGDAVYVIETKDESLATAAIAAMPAVSPSPSGAAPSASAGASSTSPSPSAASTPSAVPSPSATSSVAPSPSPSAT